MLKEITSSVNKAQKNIKKRKHHKKSSKHTKNRKSSKKLTISKRLVLSKTNFKPSQKIILIKEKLSQAMIWICQLIKRRHDTQDSNKIESYNNKISEYKKFFEGANKIVKEDLEETFKNIYDKAQEIKTKAKKWLKIRLVKVKKSLRNKGIKEKKMIVKTQELIKKDEKSLPYYRKKIRAIQHTFVINEKRYRDLKFKQMREFIQNVLKEYHITKYSASKGRVSKGKHRFTSLKLKSIKKKGTKRLNKSKKSSKKHEISGKWNSKLKDVNKLIKHKVVTKPKIIKTTVVHKASGLSAKSTNFAPAVDKLNKLVDDIPAIKKK